ncbi:hypothetical protein ASF98_06965 [Arthrobacter sp. Leaf337]|uniref:DUF7793 family protein n=1 Tax=unclassified Arthrobacter TaxID=235627 RepID=UPI0006FD0E61|nr:STAS/SEC14 domain-containing protein [Arthrobacter sp. Leaf337]KQR75547.1 hypothetical protein ASF98_06965 [Arthrobacter sp. Leaf337]
MATVPIGATEATLELTGGILHLRWAQGQFIDEEEARAAVAAAEKMCGTRRYPMLVTLAAPVWLSCKARRILTLPGPADRIAIVGSSPVDAVMARFFLTGKALACPARFFTSAGKAVAWLRDVPQ